MKHQKTLYTLNGEDSFITEVVKLTKQGLEVDANESCRIGAGCYILVWHDNIKEEEPVESVVEEEVVEESITPVDKPSPDWEYAKGLSPDKDALEVYALKFGINLDKRKGFTSMLKSFQGKWNSSK